MYDIRMVDQAHKEWVDGEKPFLMKKWWNVMAKYKVEYADTFDDKAMKLDRRDQRFYHSLDRSAFK